MFEVTKNTNRDKTKILQQSIASHFEVEGSRVYSYLLDFDEEYVYFEIYYSSEGRDYTWRASYDFNGTVATFSDDVVEVVRMTEYKEVEREQEAEKGMYQKIVTLLEKAIGPSQSEGLPVTKQFQEEEMIAIEKLYILPDTTDLQGYTIDLEETEAMVKSFNEANESGELQTSLFHNHKTDSFKVLKAWVNPVDCMIGDTLVEAGQPLVQNQFINKAAWEARKEGGLGGVSISAKATSVEEVELDD
tara:strand:- start:3580 stop:4317 length:738 start_codon:yes stop_codon:yes gene_type:complete